MQRDDPQPARSDYLDFELEIDEGRGREYPVAVLNSPAGEAREIMRFPFDKLALGRCLDKLKIALLSSGGRHRRAPSQEEQAVQEFGQALFDALLDGDIRSSYDVSLREAEQRDKGLRLKLRIRPPELSALPWEFLYDPRQAEYVCLSRQTPIVRYLESPRLKQPLAVTLPLRILGMVASPTDQSALDIECEKERVEQAIQVLQARSLVELGWLPGQTWRHLQEAMWGGPWHIFHFIGHGGFDANTDEGFIALADGAGRTRYLSATRLGRLLADHSALRLVLLNSCEGAKGSERDIFSSTASILVRRGIPAVLAMQYAITDTAAIELARAFYRALAYGMAVDEAVVAARKAISFAVNNTVEWGTPVLHMRSPDGVLFEIAEIQCPEQPTTPVSEALPKVDEELAEQLEQLYLDGLGAFWMKQWDKAVRSLQAVVDERPDYQDGDAAAKLEDARRRGKLEALYTQAQTAREAEDWPAMLSALGALVAEAPDYKDAAALLDMAKRRKYLAGLYTQAQQLLQAGQWQAVVNVFGQISTLDPEYPDPANLLATAEGQVAEQERQAERKDLYSRALLELNARRWLAARQLLVQLQGLEPGYRDVEPLLDRVEAEIAREEKDTRRQTRVELLYDQARELATAKEWQQALGRMQEIEEMDPQFADPEGITVRAQEEVAHQQHLENLYSQARAAGEVGDWPGAIAPLEALTSEAPGFRDAADMLEEAKRQKQLTKLYAEAQQLHQAGEWLAVMRMFEQITTIEPGYVDPEGLHAAARQEIEAQERRMEVEDLYGRAVEAVDDKRWPEAQRLLLQVQESEPGFRDVEHLLASAKAEIEQAKVERQRQERIAALYAEAQESAREGKWPQAIAKMEAIYAVEADFADPDQIAVRARQEIEEEREEAQRQEELKALYDEAAGLLKAKRYQQALDRWDEVQAIDPDYPDSKKVQTRATRKLAAGDRRTLWHHLPRWAIAAVAGLVLVAVVVAAVQMCGGNAPSAARPTATRALKATAALPEKATSTVVQVARPASVSATIVPSSQNELLIQGVTSYYHHGTESDWFYVLGEVANGTGEDLGGGLWVEGVFYDSAGEEVTKQSDPLGLDRLAAGGTLPFGMIMETSPDHPIHHYELRLDSEQQFFEWPGPVDIETSVLEVSEDGQWLSGQVQNPHSFAVRYPKAVVTCYDASGNVVVAADTAPITGQPDTLDPDQTAWLTLTPLSTLPDGPKSPDVKQCRFQALATQE